MDHNRGMNDSLPLYRAAQVRALDERAIALSGEPGYALMQHAAREAYTQLRRRWPRARTLCVLAGPGNNGGDGLELACLARADELTVRVCLFADPAGLRGSAAQAWAAWQAAGGAMDAAECLPECLLQADVVVDGLLGTGLTRPPEGPLRAAIEAVNASARPVLAIDVPSGIHADTGAVMGQAVRAELTVSFIGRKRGLYTGAALDHVGMLVFADLGVDSRSYQVCLPDAGLLQSNALAEVLRRRPRDSHKGDFGHVLAIGGAPGYGGAIRLCAQAALRAGAGLVSVATHPDTALALLAAQPELMVRGLATAQQAEAQALMARASVLALGPGLGQGTWAQGWLEAVLAAGKPLVLDADGLNMLAQGALATLPGDSVLTPHPGEAARLLGCGSGDIQADRFAAVTALRDKYKAVVVLKGAGTLVAAPGAPIRVCPAGNPGMAVGGMGDLLTGVIVALRAQGLPAATAAWAGVLVHALAGDAAAAEGERGLLPSDVLAQLRRQVNP